MKGQQGAAGPLILLAVAAVLAGCSPSQPTVESSAVPLQRSLPPSSTPLPPTSTVLLPTASPLPPTPTAPEPYVVVRSVEEIVGTWRFSNTDFSRFYEDSTLHEAYSLATLDDDPFAVNKIEFEDGRLSLRELSVSGVPPCGGKVGVYEVRLLQSGGMQIVIIKDLCGPRAGDTQGMYERVP